MKATKIELIVAISVPGGIIGKEDGNLPWKRIPNDFKHFKKTTMGHPIIMGRKTWESFRGKPLPGRPHVVITRNKDYKVPEEVILSHSFDDAIEKAREIDGEQIFIIGGGEIYKQAIENGVVTGLYITQIQGLFEGTVKFPSGWGIEFPYEIWKQKIQDDNYHVVIEYRTK